MLDAPEDVFNFTVSFLENFSELELNRLKHLAYQAGVRGHVCHGAFPVGNDYFLLGWSSNFGVQIPNKTPK